MVGRGLVFCVVLVDDDDDDYNGGDADRLITLTVTGCPLLRIGEKAMMLSHSLIIMMMRRKGKGELVRKKTKKKN